jgi:hypothetical protein
MPWVVPTKIPLPKDFTGFDPASAIQRGEFSGYSRHLPHWRLAGACYFVTFRLADSIPREVLEEIQREEGLWKQQFARHGGILPSAEIMKWQ